MVALSKKEIEILRFIRRSRHKTTASEIAKAVQLTESEVEVFVHGMVDRELINIAKANAPAKDAYYTNPEKREEIFDLIG